MANAIYPDLCPDNASTRKPVDFGARDFTSDGAVHARDLSAHRAYRFHLVHRDLTQAEAESIYAVWDADPLAPVDLTWRPDGLVYTCVWDGPPTVDHQRGPLWFTTCDLIGYPVTSVTGPPPQDEECDPDLVDSDAEGPRDSEVIGYSDVITSVRVMYADDIYDLDVRDAVICIDGVAHYGIEWLCVGDHLTSYDFVQIDGRRSAQLVIVDAPAECPDRGVVQA